jgi:hypothetical protein
MSGTRLLMMLNQLDPTESSTQFRHCPPTRYPLHWLPEMQRAAPDKLAIAQYHVPMQIIESLEEDSPSFFAMGIRWCVLSTTSAFLISHLPNRQKGSTARFYKCQADEILDTILSPPTISRLFAQAVAFNRWDVYVQLHAGVDPEVLAETLQSWDNLQLLDAATQVIVRPSRNHKVVEPPCLILTSPPTILIQYAVEHVGTITSVRSHQLLPRPGHALLTLESDAAAKVLAGCHIPCAGTGHIILTTGSQERDALLCQEMGLSQGASLYDRQPLLDTLPRSFLSIENVRACTFAPPAPIPGNDLDMEPPPPNL